MPWCRRSAEGLFDCDPALDAAFARPLVAIGDELRGALELDVAPLVLPDAALVRPEATPTADRSDRFAWVLSPSKPLSFDRTEKFRRLTTPSLRVFLRGVSGEAEGRRHREGVRRVERWSRPTARLPGPSTAAVGRSSRNELNELTLTRELSAAPLSRVVRDWRLREVPRSSQ